MHEVPKVCENCDAPGLKSHVRPERMTWGGLEPACIQYYCENCGAMEEYRTGPQIEPERMKKSIEWVKANMEKAFANAVVFHPKDHKDD